MEPHPENGIADGRQRSQGQDVHTVWQVELIDTWKHIDQQWAPKGPRDQNSPIVDALLILDIYFIFMKLLFDISGTVFSL